ncbi:MAG: prolyl oligopeptidase family serine peptidase [Kofleriaceae bacterium]
MRPTALATRALLATFATTALVACHPKTSTMTASSPPAAWPALDDKLLADSAATYNFRLGLPVPLAITPDGAVLFRRTGPRSFTADLFELAPDGTVKTLATAAELLGTGEENLSDEEKARRERTRTVSRGIVDIDVSDDGNIVMVPLGGNFFLIDRRTLKRTPIDPGSIQPYDPHLSPDGTRIAFVGGNALLSMSHTPQPNMAAQYTKPPEGHEDGKADFAAQEELGRTRGHWWSPDSKYIVFQRTDNRPIDTLYVSDPRHNDKPPVTFQYPRAGTNNAKVQLLVMPAIWSGDSGPSPTRKEDFRNLTWDATYEYLVSVQWPKNAPLTAVVIDRDQENVAVLAYDAGSSEPRVLLTENDDTWLNVNHGAPKWLDDGSGFLWMTEASGEYVLELHDKTGKLVRALTKPGFGLSSLAGVDGAFAIVEAQTDPTRQDVYRVPLAGGEPQKLSTDDGVSNAVKVKHGVVVIDTILAAGGKRTVAVGASGTRELPSVAEHPSLVPTTKLETVEIDGRTHHTAITRPRNFDASRRYPVLLKVYGGPHAITVTATRDAYVMDQFYADAGFVVVRSDNRGTPHRGRTWERAILKDLVTVPLDDQVAALKAMAAKHPEMDMSRVGIMGWSFGGYMSAMAVLLRPDVFHAAVAGAPVTDWTLYDTAYTERYMKQPKDNAKGYEHTSALTHAAKLSRPLLLIHGLTDDNVHLAHTLALIESLFVAAKRAEVITLSGTHMVPDPKLSLAREQVQIDFFRDHLAQPAK